MIELIGQATMLRTTLAAWLDTRPTMPQRWPVSSRIAIVLSERTSGTEAQAALERECRAGEQVILISATTDRTTTSEAIRLGAHGFLDVRDEISELDRAIRVVAGGGVYLSSCVFELMGSDDEGRVAFSDRERSLAELLVDGLPIKIAATRMGVSYDTARSYLKRIRRKYQVIGIDARTQIALVTRLRHDLTR